ncbi:TadE/TadG family type IV pilus assembly protein [Yoonia litorea]|uniref:TadE-like protein n=1 Tax=Yoonia litorea TaxID=1123755 RepID=A0A1I6LLD9_9RHOB|nr:TadE/TadG family type IV pilus assembly protein [Yoonia litorea]SFS04120.1 TadE-like protein [Yoonia litorea]
MMVKSMMRFARDERGSATIESLLWFPLFVYLLVLITDVSFIFYGKAQALRIIQDGNRAYSIRYPGVTSEAQAEAIIRANLLPYDPDPEVDTTYFPATGLIETTVRLNAEELMAIGTVPFFGDFEFELVAQHFQEQ